MKLIFTDVNTVGNDIDLSAFSKFGEFITYSDILDNSQLIEKCKDAEVIITNKTVFDKVLLSHFKKLKIICITATGFNNIDIEAATQMGIAVTNVPGYSTNSVSQRTFSMLFYLMEQLRFYDEYVKSGKYAKSSLMCNFDHKFNELAGKKWGIIGMGNIGRKVASIATAFGAHVSYYSTSSKNNQQDYPLLSLPDLLKTSDVISIHAPLNQNTDNLIDEKQFGLMKKNAILINVGRGNIVNEPALARALDNNNIFAAGLDVLSNEPILENNPLLKINEPNRLLITPHNAWASIESRTTLINEIVLNIEAFYASKQRNRIC